MSFFEYLKSTKGELKYINWPTRKETISYTIIVIIIAFFIGFYLGALDYIFVTLLEFFIL